MRLRGRGAWVWRAAAVSVAVVCAVAPTGMSNAVGGPAAKAAVNDWAAWTHDIRGSRFADGETKITPQNVGGLTLKWAFAYPKLAFKTAKSQPAVVGGIVYFGSPDGKFYALDAKTGAMKWSFNLNTVDPGVGDTAVRNGPTVQNGKVIFGDQRAYMYALDQTSGALLWWTRLDNHPYALFTGSPTYWKGKIYVGVSSLENGQGVSYPCCTFRGQLAALDADTGAVVWRYYTVPPATAVGTWPSGATMYAPSGASVWATPAIDPASGTVFVGTGNNYTGVGPGYNESVGDHNTLLAFDAATGQVRWKKLLVPNDVYRATCSSLGTPDYCPGLTNGSALDWDLSAAPNVFQVDGRTVVGLGGKEGVYRVFDARTGAPVWERRLGIPLPQGGNGGIQWGASFDRSRLYVATYQADPGTLFALDPASGATLWSTPAPADGCTTGGVAPYADMCKPGFTPAVTSSPGIVFEGSMDGKFRAFSAATGQVLWEYDTIRTFTGVNGLLGTGGALSGNSGAVVSDGMVFVQSGYIPFYPTDKGYVLLAFGR
jgi:polyvinyl alcohol dehydrogenase (cytochrome)